MSNIQEMTKREFEELPYRKSWKSDLRCDSIVIIPGGGARSKLHDSGYRVMDFAAVRDGKAICLLSGCSDVLHLDGIGGLGHEWLSRYKGVPRAVPPSGWVFDCLPKSGLLQLWPTANNTEILCGGNLSSFEIYAVPCAARESSE